MECKVLKHVKDGELVAVEIPIINVRIDFDDISEETMKWDDAMEYARSKGKRLLTKEEVGVIIYLQNSPELYKLKRTWWSWTSSGYEGTDRRHAFRIEESGIVDYGKDYRFYAVPVSDLKTRDYAADEHGKSAKEIIERIKDLHAAVNSLTKKQKVKDDDIEYIRKDALLEWAKSFTEPKIFITTLIDKINSL